CLRMPRSVGRLLGSVTVTVLPSYRAPPCAQPIPRTRWRRQLTWRRAQLSYPVFLPGLWEYRRTLVSEQSAKPQVSTVRKCADPGADSREKMAALRKENC